MKIFSGRKSKDKLILVFDIGSSSVGAAFFRTEESGIPKIIMALREPIALQKNLDAELLLASTIKSLQVVVDKIYKAGAGKPEEIFCVLSSPLHLSETRVITYERNTPFIFTAKLADDLMEREVTIFEEENFEKYKDSPVRPIELKNLKVMLNGYETPNPLNQKARELEMTIFVSIAPEQFLKKVENAIRQHFSFEKIKFSSFAMTSFTVVRDMYLSQENFLLIEIGGEMTDISMVKKNVLRESTSFPLGRNFIIRKIAFGLSSTPEEAKSFISLFQNGHAEEKVAKVIGPVINQLKTEWLKKFQESLANLSKDISIPATIFLTVDKEMADFFRQTIENEQFNQYTLTESKFKVIFFSSDIFHGWAEFEDNIIRDPGLIIDSIYINKFLINPLSSAVKSAAIK